MLFNVFIVRFDNCLNMGPDGNTGMCSLGLVSSQLGTSDELTVAILKTPIIKYPVSCFVHHCQDVGQQLIAVISLQEAFRREVGTVRIVPVLQHTDVATAFQQSRALHRA